MCIFLFFVLLDPDGAATPESSSHVLMITLGAVRKRRRRSRRKHSEQKLLQEIAHLVRLITWPKILEQRVLEHAIGVDRFEVGKEEAKGAPRYVLKHFFDLLGTVAPADLLQNGLALQLVRESWPDEHAGEVDAYDVG